MPADASAIFNFISSHPHVEIERHEVCCPHFYQFRRAVRAIVKLLQESDEPYDAELASTLRVGLFNLLSSPVSFTQETFAFLGALGSQNQVTRNWGEEMGRLFRIAGAAAEQLLSAGSKLREVYLDVLRSSLDADEVTRIYCHSAAEVAHHLQRSDLQANKPSFLHTPREYRESPIFDTLIKVGPLRGRGWASVPDGIVTAARFRILRQILWEGSSDEPEFGFDPATRSHIQEPPATVSIESIAKADLSRSVIRHGSSGNSADDVPEEDDFAILSVPARPRLRTERQALLVQIEEGQGIFYFPGSRIMSFDPDSEAELAMAYRIPGTTLEDGMFIVRWIDDEGVTAIQSRAEHGRYSRTWKQELQVAMHKGEQQFIRRLRENGLALVNLHPALAHWSRDPTTVIHAPQKKEHFEILIRTIGINPGAGITLEKWIQQAWREIARTRGEAIGQGLADHAIAELEIMRALSETVEIVRKESHRTSQFTLALPRACAVGGRVMFFKVLSVERGFFPPDSAMRVITNLEEAARWHA